MTGKGRKEALDPRRLAERQLAIDDEHLRFGVTDTEPVGRRPLGADERARAAIAIEARKRKVTRMQASPLAFLRGAAPLFYEVLALAPELADGPLGKGWLAGDLHLENFGAYEPGPWRGPREIAPPVFDLNDFDEAFVGPLRWDMLRLVTSLLLGSRELGTTGVESVDLARALFESYTGALFDGRGLPPKPPVVKRLLARAERRSESDFASTYAMASGERLILSPKLLDPGPRLRALVPAAMDAYASSLPESEVPKPTHMEVLDCAFRLAGTGSLGCTRIAVLVRGKRAPWIFDMKSENVLSAAPLLVNAQAGTQPAGVRAERMDPVERVITGQRAAVAHPPVLVGRTVLDGTPMLVRKLTEEEDKLDLPTVPKEELPVLVAYLGALVGRAHGRGMTEQGLAHRWTRGDTEAILESGFELAGVHEGTYLAYSKLTHGG